MNTNLTVRLPEAQRRQLRKLAAKLGKSDSEVVRQMIGHGLARESLGPRIAHLRGSLPESPAGRDPLARGICARNWRT